MKLYKSVEKYLYDPGVGTNLLNKIPKAHTTKAKCDGFGKTKIKLG